MPKFKIIVEETRIWTYQGAIEAGSREEAEALAELDRALLRVVDKEVKGCHVIVVEEIE